MKKHRDADELAARITAAASQPPGGVVAAPVINVPKPTLEATPKKAMKAGAKQNGTKEPDENTVPISLRPGRALLNRYIIATAERTRGAGRVISAQQIMLEVLERGI